MWNFEHPPEAARLRDRYDIHYTLPSACADDLLSGRAALGLIPIAALTPALAIVPGCVIASPDDVRSILLLIRGNLPLSRVRTLAADTASRSSAVYAEILFHYAGAHPRFLPHLADPIPMLETADAALLIGDPALLAREARDSIERAVGPCQWIDLAHEWHIRTGLPWVAAVWAADPAAIARSPLSPTQITTDLTDSRDAGLRNIDRIVDTWTPRLPVPPAILREYLTRNIHYLLDEPCLAAIRLFRAEAAAIGALPPLPGLHMLA